MGEEKPDEELMGKRKSSPRLSTASLDAAMSRIAESGRNIHRTEKNVSRSGLPQSDGFSFFSAVKVWYDSKKRAVSSINERGIYIESHSG
jgi:hypothetical protein